MFSRGKVYFTSEILFYNGKFSFFREKLVNPIFSIRKNRFVRKIQVLTPKTRFSRGKVYFTSEIVFYSGKFSFSKGKLVEIPFFSIRKVSFVRKIQVSTPKTRFSRDKGYFVSEIVFYVGNLSFSREKLVEILFLSIRKNLLVRKIHVLTPKTKFSRGKVYFTSKIVFYSGKFGFFSRKTCRNTVFSH